jgi:hypothetical protein
MAKYKNDTTLVDDLIDRKAICTKDNYIQCTCKHIQPGLPHFNTGLLGRSKRDSGKAIRNFQGERTKHVSNLHVRFFLVGCMWVWLVYICFSTMQYIYISSAASRSASR